MNPDILLIYIIFNYTHLYMKINKKYLKGYIL